MLLVTVKILVLVDCKGVLAATIRRERFADQQRLEVKHRFSWILGARLGPVNGAENSVVIHVAH